MIRVKMDGTRLFLGDAVPRATELQHTLEGLGLEPAHYYEGYYYEFKLDPSDAGPASALRVAVEAAWGDRA